MTIPPNAIPQNPVLIIHFHEIALKRGNQAYFENILKRNIAQRLRDIPGARVRHMRNRLVVRGLRREDAATVMARLQKVFGIVNISVGAEVDAEMEAMKAAAQALVQSLIFESFAVRPKRAEKRYPFTSQDIGREVGSAVWEVSHARVDLTNPELEVFVEVVQGRAYLFAGKVPGPGGLPVSSSGRGVALFSVGFDAPVAAWRMMKRGLSLHLVHFHGQPQTDDASVRKARALAKVLAEWHGRIKLTLIAFSQAQEIISVACPERYRTILYRRMMMRVANKLAWKHRARALVTGESLGQVASQTLPNMAAIEDAAAFPVLRPLIAFDKQEIIAEAQHIGTHDISILPHDEACILFQPRRVETAAKIEDVRAAEEALDIPWMLDQLMKDAETEVIYPDWWVDDVDNR
ncbi:MAG TPA: tRNA 4-thiouridine(8) synthase ThiI [Caldilineales bacterium]|nr:tRNA 4-thiouridine(8) synthase ThiI [Caldilineales bacterium]